MQTRPTLQQVILGFLQLYLDFRQPTWRSPTNSVKYGFEFAASYITGVDPVDVQLGNMVTSLMTNTTTSLDFDSYYKLALKLREKAVGAQSLKSDLKTDPDKSLLHNTLHAISNFIIDELENTIEFEEKIKQLEARYTELQVMIEACIKDKKGKNIQDLNNELNDVILELARLKKPWYVNEALNRKLLGPVTSLTENELNEFIKYQLAQEMHHSLPQQMQKNYAEKLYIEKYRGFKTVEFVKFIETCVAMPTNNLTIHTGTRKNETVEDSAPEENNTSQQGQGQNIPEANSEPNSQPAPEPKNESSTEKPHNSAASNVNSLFPKQQANASSHAVEYKEKAAEQKKNCKK